MCSASKLAVANRSVDVAVAWDPHAGYFAQQPRVPLVLTPVIADTRNPSLPFHFDIAIGVRPVDTELRDQLNAELIRRHTEIAAILTKYGVPQLPLSTSQTTADTARKGE